jgi:hypothetical protein
MRAHSGMLSRPLRRRETVQCRVTAIQIDRLGIATTRPGATGENQSKEEPVKLPASGPAVGSAARAAVWHLLPALPSRFRRVEQIRKLPDWDRLPELRRVAL